MKLDFPSLLNKIGAHHTQWHANDLLIESAASGIGLIQSLRSRPGAPQPISVGAHKDKVIRMSNVSAMLEAHQVSLPKQAPWLADFRAEVLQFPNGKHDDQIDSMSQFLNWKRRQKANEEIFVGPKVFGELREAPDPAETAGSGYGILALNYSGDYTDDWDDGD